MLALLPMTFYGEGLRRALLRFSRRREETTPAGAAGWPRCPCSSSTPVLLYPLLLTVPVMADLAGTAASGPTVGRVAVGFYAVLAALTVPLAWGFRVVGAGRVRWPALLVGAFFTAACLSGFLQGFVLFLRLPLDLGAPVRRAGRSSAAWSRSGLWLFLLHLVVHRRLAAHPGARRAAGADGRAAPPGG